MREPLLSKTIHMEVVLLNVGGWYFVTSRETLMHTPGTYLDTLAKHSGDSDIFIDRDPTQFRHVLNWLRGVRHLPSDYDACSELVHEALFYCLPDMVNALQKHITNLTGTQFVIPPSLRIAPHMP